MSTVRRTAAGQPIDPRLVRWNVDTGRYWRGAVSAALAAALTAIVGLLVVRGLFGLPVLRRTDGGQFEQASTLWYVVVAALGALLAAALLQLLLSFSPTPWRFYRWIAGLAVTAVTILPLTFPAAGSTKFATAVLHLVVALVAVVFVEMVGRACAVLVYDER